MDVLTALLVELIVIAILFEVARRLSLPYPALFVLGGLALGFVPWIPHITLEPDLVLLVFLPPLLFGAAFETPLRDLRTNIWPIARLSVGLVLLTTVTVAAVAQALVPGLGWAAAFTLGAIVAPTDALAATSVFRRLGVPRIALTLIEGEALFNDASALILYRAALIATIFGTFVLSDAIGNFVIASIGGVIIGFVVGRVTAEIVRWLDDPPVEVLVSLLIPYLAYLLAVKLEVSGVLAVVTAGLVIGRRLGTMLSPNSRVLWLTSWKMVAFVLNGLVFVLLGLALPDILRAPSSISTLEFLGIAFLVCAAAIGTRFLWVFASSFLPNSPRRRIAETDPRARLAARVPGRLVGAPRRGVAGRGPRAAAGLPGAQPDPAADVRGDPGHARRPGADAAARRPLGALGRRRRRAGRGRRWRGRRCTRSAWARSASRGHAGRTTSRCSSGSSRGSRTASDTWRPRTPRRPASAQQEHQEHEEIQLSVINAQRGAVIALRDAGEINDTTLRLLERELDLEELRMEA